jgi:hypothetical protein
MRKVNYVLSLTLCASGLLGATQGIARTDLGLGLKTGGENFGVELLGPRWFNESLCLTVSALFDATQDKTLLREETASAVRIVSQGVDSRAIKGGLTWYPFPEATIRPYVAGGGGISFREWDFFDRTIESQRIVAETTASDRGTSWVSWASIGAEWALSESWFLMAEFQYDWAPDFHGQDMQGLAFFAGLRWRF